jgi:hypothetical protein
VLPDWADELELASVEDLQPNMKIMESKREATATLPLIDIGFGLL